MNELISKNWIIWIAANLPRARVQISSRIKGGKVVCLPRWSYQSTNPTMRETPEISMAMRSTKRDFQHLLYFMLCHRDSHGVFHFCGASSPCPSTNMIHTNPVVINIAPIQSTRLSSFSSDKLLSASMEK